jgi:uncharacterized protein YacL
VDYDKPGNSGYNCSCTCQRNLARLPFAGTASPAIIVRPLSFLTGEGKRSVQWGLCLRAEIRIQGACLMSSEFVFRLIGMVVFSIIGIFLGVQLGEATGESPELAGLLLGLVGALAGLILTPYLTTRPFKRLRRDLFSMSTQSLIAGLIGLVVGLIIAALLTFPLSLLPSPFGKILPFIAVLLFGYFGVTIFVHRQEDIFTIFRSFSNKEDEPKEPPEPGQANGRTILLDTSVIIDGRIADIARTGFLVGTLLIPRFVLNELQFIADSSDSLRRQRGRRGIEVISQLQKDTSIPLRINDIDVEGVREVDDKLVVLARQMRCPILTNDYNLNRVAELQGVTVLNVNELANAVKIVFLPGESLTVDLIQEGKEAGQGVGYLDDGTMVVVEDGRGQIDRAVSVTVTKVLQTAAGRMIFGRITKD